MPVAYLVQHPVFIMDNQLPVGSPQTGPEHKSPLPACISQELVFRSINVSDCGGSG